MILEVDNTLISTEIFSTNFVCHLEKCKGACCIEGDRGATLDKKELALIESRKNALEYVFDDCELVEPEWYIDWIEKLTK